MECLKKENCIFKRFGKCTDALTISNPNRCSFAGKFQLNIKDWEKEKELEK